MGLENSHYVGTQIPVASVLVENNASDLESPVISSVSVASHKNTAGNRVSLFFTAHDNLSRIENYSLFSGEVRMIPGKKGVKPKKPTQFHLAGPIRHLSNFKFLLSSYIPVNLENGNYYLSSFRVADRVGNITTLRTPRPPYESSIADVSKRYFEVQSMKGDLRPTQIPVPVLHIVRPPTIF
jgi:hypothetical protein